MPIYQIAHYQVKPKAVEKVKQAIETFVHYVQAHESGTRLYESWQQKTDPTKFVHFFIFENEDAQTKHSTSEAVKKFEAVYKPELIGREEVFTDYELVATSVE